MKFDLNCKISLTVTILFLMSLAFCYVLKNHHYKKELFKFIADNNFSEGNYFQSSKYYKKLISMGDGDEDVYKNMAISMIKTGYYDRAIEYLKKILKKDKSSDVYYALGYAYYQKAQTLDSLSIFNKAMGYLNESITLNKENNLAYRLMGRILQFAHWGDLDQLAADNDDLRLFLEEGGCDFPGVVDQIEAQTEMVLSDTCAEN